MLLFQFNLKLLIFSKGANAVEVDVTFSKDGDPLYTYHGPPCDCWRHCHQQEDFNDYLRYVREIAIEEPHGIGKNFSLLFLDLKLNYLDHKTKARAGSELAKSIKENLFLIDDKSFLENQKIQFNSTAGEFVTNNSVIVGGSNPKFRIIVSVNHVNDLELINNFLHYLEINNSSHLLNMIGFDVGMNDDLQQIDSMWKRFGNTLNVWQGDGYTNCFSPFYNLRRLTKAIEKRDSEIGYPRKVYQWTIDLHDRMRDALRLGVDAIMTNHPERLLTVLQEPDIAHDYRLATREDNPFEKITIKVSSKSSELARHRRSNTPTFFGSIIDVITSWFAYIKEIPFLSLPTTSRFISSKTRRNKQSLSMYKLLPNTGDKNITTMMPSVDGIQSNDSSSNQNLERVSSSDSSTDQSTNQTTDATNLPAYEGPKWYTSLVSNVLVSFMKILLPT